MTYIIIALTVLVSLAAFRNRELFYKMQFNAYQIAHRKDYKKLVTHIFIHADWGHLFVNMFSFYFFGRVIEAELTNYFETSGHLHFVILYLSAGIVCSLPSLMKHKDNINYNAVGASGSVSAIIYAFIMFHPFDMIYVFFIPMPAILYGLVFLGFSYYMAKKNIDNIGHDAHFWGSVYGVVYVIIFIPGIIPHFFKELGIF